MGRSENAVLVGGGPAVHVRALAALVLLALFPLVALLLAAGCVALSLWSLTTDASGLARVLVTPGMAVLVVLVIVTRSLMRARRLPDAVDVTEPELWVLVKDVAAQVGTPPPDRLRLIAEPNARVLRMGAVRYLDVGLPLLAVLDTGQLRAVLAHEMGHHRGGHVRFASAVYQGYELMTGIVEGLRLSLLRPVLRGHLALYWRVASKVLRNQEMAADQAAVAATDPATTASALLEITRCGAAWEDYLARLVPSRRIVPGDVCGGFRDFYRSQEILVVPSAVQVPGDSHPPMAQRIAAIGDVEDRGGVDDSVVLTRWQELTNAVDELLFPARGRQRVPVHHYLAEAHRGRNQRAADRLFRAAQRIGGVGNIGGVLDLLASGRAPHLAKEVLRADPGPRPEQIALVIHLTAALELTADGDPAELARAAVAGDVEPARAALTSSPPTSKQHQTVAPLGAMTIVEANARPFVLVLLEHGLALLPTTYEDPIIMQTVEQILATGALPDNAWHLLYEDFAAARVAAGRVAAGRVTVKQKLRMDIELRDGTRLVLRETSATEVLALGPRGPREILAGVAAALQRVHCGDPRPGLPLAKPASARVSPASTAAISSGRRFGGLVFLLAAVPLGIAAAVGAGPAAVTASIGSAAMGVLMVGIDMAMRPEQTRWRGVGFSLFGLVITATGVFGLTYAERAGPVVGFTVFGVGLMVLGVLRWRGRWPRVRGNGFKIAALLAACVGVGVTVNFGVPGLALLVPSVALFAAGIAMTRAARRSPFEVPGRVTVSGVIALFFALTGGVGLVMSVWAIAEARKVGVRPTLGLTALALSIAVLLIFFIVLVTNNVSTHS